MTTNFAPSRCTTCGVDFETDDDVLAHLGVQPCQPASERPLQVLITTKDGQQWLIDFWPNHDPEVSYRPEPYGSVPWTPAEFSSVGAKVEVKR